MQLNLINKSVIVESAVNESTLIPRQGEAVAVGGDVFKFIPQGRPEDAVLIARLDLGVLFKNIPQDISGFSEIPQVPVESTRVLSAIAFPTDRLDPAIDETLQVFNPQEEITGYWFNIWCEWVGLRDLPRAEVELGIIDDLLIIDASRAKLYKGQVTVKIRG